jgi:hypothetical protein
VRFSKKEFKKVLKAQQNTGLSIQQILKKCFAKNGDMFEPILTKEQGNIVIANLRIVGERTNEIAKEVNSGNLYGWDNDFKRIAAALVKIKMQAQGLLPFALITL